MIEQEDVCGEAYDHDPETVYEDEEVYQWVCTNCGAEGFEDKKCPKCNHKHPEGFSQCVLLVKGERCGCEG